ncbi:hypothetical protein FRB96_001597 [Tulasnella sp. 330]|nr:hypothetical protein FRB96_001597 [Tulasnella sp. 330]
MGLDPPLLGAMDHWTMLTNMQLYGVGVDATMLIRMIRRRKGLATCLDIKNIALSEQPSDELRCTLTELGIGLDLYDDDMKEDEEDDGGDGNNDAAEEDGSRRSNT